MLATRYAQNETRLYAKSEPADEVRNGEERFWTTYPLSSGDWPTPPGYAISFSRATLEVMPKRGGALTDTPCLWPPRRTG
jgi:hypothetical protein